MFFSTPSWKLWSELRMPRGKLWSSLFIISTSSFGCLLFNKDLWLPQFLMLFTMPWEDAGERKRKSISIRQIHLWNFARKKKFSTLKKKKNRHNCPTYFFSEFLWFIYFLSCSSHVLFIVSLFSFGCNFPSLVFDLISNFWVLRKLR